MAETPQQYVERIRKTLGDRKPMEVLSSTPARLAELVKARSASELNRKPAPDKWSVAEILAHLADVEMVVGYRIRTMLSSSGAPIQGFDQDAWARDGRYASVPVADSLQRQAAQRKANLALWRSLTAEQWQHHGMHSERGKETIERTSQLIAGHDINHLQQIEKILNRVSESSRH